MSHLTTSPTHRAAEKLISSKGTCSCDGELALQRKIFDAKGYLVAAIVRLGEIAEVTGEAGMVLVDCRKALSVLEEET